MSQSSPPGSLLRLREADVVRTCGLTAAAAGLEIAARQAIRDGKRREGRLEGRISGERAGDPTWVEAWVETAGQDPITFRWSCTCREGKPGEASPLPPLACPHVAALLTSWIRDPASFAATSPDVGEAPAGARHASWMLPDDASRVRTPTPQDPLTARTREAPREPGLADELARMSTSELLALNRRVLGKQGADAIVVPDVRQRLEAALSDLEQLATLIGRLDPEAQTLLAELLLVGGSNTARDLDAMVERGDTTPGAMRAALGVLERHALIFPAAEVAWRIHPSAESPHPWRQITGWRIPPEIRSSWKAKLPIPAARVLTPQGPPILEAGDDRDEASAHRDRDPGPSIAKTARVVRASLRQLYLTLSLLSHAPSRFDPLPREEARQTAPASTTGPQSGERSRPTARLSPFSLVPADLSIEAAGDFARGAGVPVGLAQMARRIVLFGREQGTARMLLDLPLLSAEDQRYLLQNAWRAWCGTELPLELADLALPGSRVRCGFDWRHEALRPAALAAEVGAARSFLLHIVRHMEPGVWYRLSALLDLIWRINPFFLRGRQNAFTTPAWWLEAIGKHRPLRAGLRDEWMEGEAEYIRAWLTGPLHWWGVLDLATTAAGRLVGIRLTSMGAHLLDLNEQEDEWPGLAVSAEEWGPALVVTPQGRLAVAPLAAGAPLQDALATWARPLSIAGGRIIYTFDAGLAAEAFDRGLAPDHLLSLLRQDSTTAGKRALAATEKQLTAWNAAYGGSSITTGWTLLEARDEATLDEALLHLPRLHGGDTEFRRLSPTHALVTARLLSTLEVDLRKRGFATLS